MNAMKEGVLRSSVAEGRAEEGDEPWSHDIAFRRCGSCRKLQRYSTGSKAIAMTPEEGAAEIAGRIQATIKKVGGGKLLIVRVSYCIPISISPPPMILQKQIVLGKDFVIAKLPKLSVL